MGLSATMDMRTTQDASEAPVARPAASRPPIDRAHLSRYTFGNAALEIEVLGLFAGQAPETLAWLRTAETAKAWRDAAHTLKGSARAVGAWRVAELAERAEAIDPAARDARARIVAGLTAALAEACAWVEALSTSA